MTAFPDDAMMGPTSNAPRRYFVDGGGHRVLIGLTPEETCEFERLDSEQATGCEPPAPDGRAGWLDAGHRRRRELYEKHEDAWKAWMAQSRTGRSEGFNLS